MSKSNQYQRQRLNRKLNIATRQLIESAPPTQLSKHIRIVLLDYLLANKDFLPVDFDIYLSDFSNLFQFLDAIAQSDNEHN